MKFKIRATSDMGYVELMKRLLKHKSRFVNLPSLIFKISFHKHRQALLFRLVEMLEVNQSAMNIQWNSKVDEGKNEPGCKIIGQFSFYDPGANKLLTILHHD